jgi:hypothetical protein
MVYLLLVVICCVGLFGGMLLLLEVGRRIGIRRMEKDAEGAKAGIGAVVGAIFSLLGLLIAFTFSGASSRFDARVQLGIREANSIRTAYYLIELLPDPAKASLKDNFRKYLDAELEVIKKLPDLGAAKEALIRRSASQLEIENEVIAAYADPNIRAPASLLLSAISQWIDISKTREIAANTHPPILIFAMLMGLALVSSLIAGYGMAEAKSRSWLHIVTFAAVISVVIYVIIDLEFPRFGLIRLDAADRFLVDLRQTMK